MQKENIVFQVSEETAGIMEEISEQLYEENQNRFDEVSEGIEENLKKIERLYEDFSIFVKKSDVSEKNSREHIEKQIGIVLESIANYTTQNTESSKDLGSKSECIIDIVKVIGKDLQDGNSSIKESSLLLKSCCENIEKINESQRYVCDNDEKILQAEKNNLELTKQVYEHNEMMTKEILEEFEKVSKRLEDISMIINNVVEKQEELSKKQDEIEKDVKYMKLPFYKKWFSKGE